MGLSLPVAPVLLVSFLLIVFIGDSEFFDAGARLFAALKEREREREKGEKKRNTKSPSSNRPNTQKDIHGTFSPIGPKKGVGWQRQGIICGSCFHAMPLGGARPFSSCVDKPRQHRSRVCRRDHGLCERCSPCLSVPLFRMGLPITCTGALCGARKSSFGCLLFFCYIFIFSSFDFLMIVALLLQKKKKS